MGFSTAWLQHRSQECIRNPQRILLMTSTSMQGMLAVNSALIQLIQPAHSFKWDVTAECFYNVPLTGQEKKRNSHLCSKYTVCLLPISPRLHQHAKWTSPLQSRTSTTALNHWPLTLRSFQHRERVDSSHQTYRIQSYFTLDLKKVANFKCEFFFIFF